MSSDLDNSNTNDRNVKDSSSINENGGKQTAKATSLKVVEPAEQRDVRRKVACIDPEVAEHLNISSGDVIELSSLGSWISKWTVDD